nr:retinoic acid receptor rxr beta a,retinoic acid receptor rxr alpha a,retinoic acid receptor rxr alpha [Hymenolepis microstoma]
MDSSTSNFEKSDWPPSLHDHDVFESYNLSLRPTNSKQDYVSPTPISRINPGMLNNQYFNAATQVFLNGNYSFDPECVAQSYTKYIPSGHICNDAVQAEININGNGQLENQQIESSQASSKKLCSRSEQEWAYISQPTRGPRECSNMEQSYQNEIPEPTYSGYQDLITSQQDLEYIYPREFRGKDSGVDNDHAGMLYYSNPQTQYALQSSSQSYLGQWFPQLPSQSLVMNPQPQEYQSEYPEIPCHYQPIPQPGVLIPPTSNASRSKRGRKSKSTASDSRGCTPIANQGTSSSKKICVICEERPISEKLMSLDLCQYCLVDYKNAINLDLLEDCKCSALQESLHKPASCWRCVVSKCLAKNVNKEVVKAAKLNGNTPSDPLAILQKIFPFPKQANAFTPEIDFPPAERALPQSSSLISVLKDEEILASCYLESGVNFTVWATQIPLFSTFTPQEQMQILKSGFLPVLLVRFAFKLAQLLPASKVPADLSTQETDVSLADVVLGASEYLFSLNEFEALKQSMTSNECRFVLFLCSADYQFPDNEESGEESIELNQLTISQRYTLRQLFELGEYFRDLKFSPYAIQCLCMVLLYENEKPGIPDELKLKMKQPLKEAQNYFRVALRQSNVADAEYFRMVFTHRQILNLAEKLRTTVGSEFQVPGKNIVGLDSVITQTFPDFIKEQNNS